MSMSIPSLSISYEAIGDPEVIFADEDEDLNRSSQGQWKVMIVDDDEEVHNVTKLALDDFSFDGRSLEFVSVFSGEEARKAIQAHPDTAAILLDVVMEEAVGVKLEDAQIVVSGGRGLGGPEPFKDLEELAKLLGGAVGASRAAVDSGWVPPAYQVGLTGKTITPDLYITIAISGASQHMAGCSGAKVIVAINKDAESNIFKEARYGVVGDWEHVVPAFTEAVRELTQS